MTLDRDRRLQTMAAEYRCPICGTSDPNAFARCYRPDCLDGRDQARNASPRYPPEPRRALTHDDRMVGRVFYLCIMFAVISMIYACTAHFARASDHGFSLVNPKTDEMIWTESLLVPDDLVPPRSKCCGKGDMYEADVYDIDGYDHGRKECEAEVTDGSAKKWPDGTARTAIANGTKFTFPCSKVNPPKDGNPTGHAQAFLSVVKKKADNGSWVFDKINSLYCFVPLQPGS